MEATQAAVDAFKMPGEKRGKPGADHLEFFTGKPGFGLRVRNSPNGSERRTYVYQYKVGEQHRRITIGDVGAVKLKAAVGAMQIHAGQIAKGKDPARDRAEQRLQQAAERRQAITAKAAKTLIQHVADFLEGYEATVAPRTFVETKRLLEKDYWQPLHSLQLNAVDRPMIATRLAWIKKNKGTVPARHARAALSLFYGWAIGEGRCDANPVTGTNRIEAPTPRDRVLTDAELAAVWTSAPATDYGHIVRLLALTAQRRDEIGSLRWSEVDTQAKTITLPAGRTKTGKAHTVPLSDDALAIIKAIPQRAGRDLVFGEGEGGFSGWSAAKATLDKSSGVKEWRLHDLRRTAATPHGR